MTTSLLDHQNHLNHILSIPGQDQVEALPPPATQGQGGGERQDLRGAGKVAPREVPRDARQDGAQEGRGEDEPAAQEQQQMGE